MASLHLWFEGPDTELLHSHCCRACAVLLKPVHDGAIMSSASAVCSCILWFAAVTTITCASLIACHIYTVCGLPCTQPTKCLFSVHVSWLLCTCKSAGQLRTQSVAGLCRSLQGTDLFYSQPVLLDTAELDGKQGCGFVWTSCDGLSACATLGVAAYMPLVAVEVHTAVGASVAAELEATSHKTTQHSGVAVGSL